MLCCMRARLCASACMRLIYYVHACVYYYVHVHACMRLLYYYVCAHAFNISCVYVITMPGHLHACMMDAFIIMCMHAFNILCMLHVQTFLQLLVLVLAWRCHHCLSLKPLPFDTRDIDYCRTHPTILLYTCCSTSAHTVVYRCSPWIWDISCNQLFLLDWGLCWLLVLLCACARMSQCVWVNYHTVV